MLKISTCLPPKAAGLPTHAGILRQAEQIARGLFQQHLLRHRQCAGGARRMRLYIENPGLAGIENTL